MLITIVLPILESFQINVIEPSVWWYIWILVRDILRWTSLNNENYDNWSTKGQKSYGDDIDAQKRINVPDSKGQSYNIMLQI